MQNSDDPTVKINYIIDQINDVKLGRRFSILCPFCGEYNQRGAALLAPDEWKRPLVSPLCCDDFKSVAEALSGAG